MAFRNRRAKGRGFLTTPPPAAHEGKDRSEKSTVAGRVKAVTRVRADSPQPKGWEELTRHARPGPRSPRRGRRANASTKPVLPKTRRLARRAETNWRDCARRSRRSCSPPVRRQSG